MSPRFAAMSEIAIIDYGMCNLDSVARAVEKCGGLPVVTGEPDVVGQASAIILPGVGSFCDAMRELEERSLVKAIREQVKGYSIPFLGICLGMQLMATTGHEGGVTRGIDLIPGEVVRLKSQLHQERIPHVGWNEVEQAGDSCLFSDISDMTDFYFVHSYRFVCASEYVLASTPYCGGLVSAVGVDRCFGVQFHPEKSLAPGQKMLTNFLELC
ncbi:MAG: imidazole glycerol phosphate synthase subunit HisH [Desulfobulbaceae bacterium]|nr:imidazole glycerol phosphate synthase subunit HisH [Desulfobulbaceae bacterium]